MKKEIPPRWGLRLINTGPVVIATCGSAESPNGITLAWCMPASHSPAMAAISVAPQRYSHDLIKDRGVFCVNVPGGDMLDCVMYMGTHSGRNGDKFGPAGVTPAPAASLDTVAIAECPGHIECEVAEAVTAGDHTVFIGEIKAAFVEESLFSNNHWNLEQLHGQTLHHLGEVHFGLLEKTVVFEKS